MGTSLLETRSIIFRGDDYRLEIPFTDIVEIQAISGVLKIDCNQGVVDLMLGKHADSWLEKILHPPTLMKKLGVAEDSSVLVLGIEEQVISEIRSVARTVSENIHNGPYDCIFFEANEVEDLQRLSELKKVIVPNGSVWVVSKKGKHATLIDVEVMKAAKESGLVDIKVVSFSDTHTALKLVIPKKDRR